MNRPLISVAIPAYNEASNLDELFQRLRAVFQTNSDKYDFEIIVCENGSKDDSYAKLNAWRAKDSRIRIIRLSRNFHMEGGMMAALSDVRGDACVIMSADLQDPPEMISEMIQLWATGIDHVYTIISFRHGESRFRRIAAEIFYWMIDKVSDTPVPRNSSDFRLVDKQMYEAFNALPEKYRMVRAVWGWIGFHSASLTYERQPRVGGTSSFNPFVTAGFAIRGVLASSLKPLKIIPILGILLSALSFISIILGAVQAVFRGVPFPGFGTITSLILLMFGLLFLMLSVIAEYVGMIYTETRSRPPFIIKRDRL
jgi:glycosyltransferase involved in cell wall biosynthesis